MAKYIRAQNYQIEQEESNKLLESLSLADLEYAAPWLKKAYFKSGDILGAAIKKDITLTPELPNIQKKLVTYLIDNETTESTFQIEYEDSTYIYPYWNNISLEQLQSIKDDLIEPDKLLAFAIYEAGDIQLKKELIEKALAKGADLNKALKTKHIDNLRNLNALSDYLLESTTHPADPQIFLQAVLACSTLESGENNQELIQMKQNLFEKCVSKGASISPQLTVYHDKHHAFIQLDCARCDQGQAASIYVGLYPSESISLGYCPADDIEGKQKTKIATQYIATELSGYFINSPNSPKYLLDDRYILMQEFGGGLLSKDFAFKERDYRTYADLQNMPRKSYNISEEVAGTLFSRIDHLVNTCDRELEYQVFGSNCIDFVQDMYKRAGLSGHYVEEIYGFRYPQNIFGVYKAISDIHNAVGNTTPIIQSAQSTFERLRDISPLILAGTVVLEPTIAAVTDTISRTANSVYQYFLGTKITEEELNNTKLSIESTKPETIKAMANLQKIFDEIYHHTYSDNLNIANEEYDERTNKYKSQKGEKAIAKVRLMAEIRSEFRELSKEVTNLIASQAELNSNSYESTAKVIKEKDKDIIKRFNELRKKKAELEALQIASEKRDKLSTHTHANIRKQKSQQYTL